MRQEKTNPKLDAKGISDNRHRGNYIALKIQQDIDLIRGSGRTLTCGSSRQLILVTYILPLLEKEIFFSERIL